MRTLTYPRAYLPHCHHDLAMKTLTVFLLFVASWCCVNSCRLESCSGKEFKNCDFSDKSCRDKTFLNLANKGLSGPIPSSFYSLFGENTGGDPTLGIKKVQLTKVDLQGNLLAGGIRNLFSCKTIKEMYVQSSFRVNLAPAPTLN